jgi:hypothetical protein
MAKKSRRAKIPSAPAERAIPTPVGEPTSFAKLEISTAQVTGSASAKVPPNDARHMMTTFGIMGSLFIGVGGTVLTLRVSATLIGPALAELLVTLVTVVVIAVSGRIRP